MERASGTGTPPRGDLNLLVGGRYRLIEQIRGGGMGTVWKAEDERLGRLVAVKILHGTLDGDATVRERFRREAIAASKVSHPAIAGVYDYVEDPDRRAIIMELVEGETLAARIARGPLEADEARRIFGAVLAGLQAAHDGGVLHRDIKPSNILMRGDGTIKLADFGVATMTGDATLTATGTIMATPQYAAPEQLRGAPSTPATDVYQTGVALYEALSGRLPFGGDTPVTVAMARLSQDPRPLTIPAGTGLSDVAMTALEREPERRYASAAQMRAALLGDATALLAAPLSAAVGDMTVPLAAGDAETVMLAAPPRPVRPHRLRRIAIRAALIALIVALAATGLTAAFSGPGTFAAPSLTNRSIAEATAAAKELNLKVAVTRRARPGLAADLVFAQEPSPGTRLTEGATVRLIAASGCCTVPRLTTYEGAKAALGDADLSLGRVTFVETVDAPPGTILSQRPVAGEPVAPGTPVDMVVAKTPPPPEPKSEGDGDRKGKRGKDNDD